MQNRKKLFKILKAFTYASELFIFDLSQASIFFDQVYSNSNLHKNIVKGFAHFLESLDLYFDMLDINSAEGCKIKIFGSVTLQNGNFLCATSSFHDQPWFSNLAIIMNNEKLFEYQSNNGICYTKVWFITI